MSDAATQRMKLERAVREANADYTAISGSSGSASDFAYARLQTARENLERFNESH